MSRKPAQTISDGTEHLKINREGRIKECGRLVDFSLDNDHRSLIANWASLSLSLLLH